MGGSNSHLIAKEETERHRISVNALQCQILANERLRRLEANTGRVVESNGQTVQQEIVPNEVPREEIANLSRMLELGMESERDQYNFQIQLQRINNERQQIDLNHQREMAKIYLSHQREIAKIRGPEFQASELDEVVNVLLDAGVPAAEIEFFIGDGDRSDEVASTSSGSKTS